jgi:hypothetical protein
MRIARVSQPPYNPYGVPPQQPDPTLRAPVDPYAPQPAQPSYDQSAYPGSPAYPSYNDPVGYPDPVSGYPGAQQPYSAPGYGDQGAQQPYSAPGYGNQGYQQPQQPPYYQPPTQPNYGGPPAYPGYQPAPSGGGGKGVMIVLVVVLLVVLVGGGIAAFALLGNKAKPGPTANGPSGPGTSQSSGTSIAPSTNAGGATHSGDLRTYLIDPPSGSRNWSTPLGTDRNLSLDQASQLSSDASERRKMLTQYNFTHGAVQTWIGSDHSVVDVRLYQFDTADHGESFFRDDIDATSSGYTAPNISTIPGVPGAEIYTDPKKDDQGYVNAIAIGIKGDIVFVVSLGEKADKMDLTLPDRLMLQEYQKL